MSDSFRPHGLQHPRLPCSSTSPGICSNTCPLSRWCHPTISAFVALFSSCPQSLPASGSFPVSWLFTSRGQSTGASASASAIPVNSQGWFPLGWTGLISLLSKGLSRVFSSTTIWKHQFFDTQPALCSNSHIHTWLLERPQLWLYRPLLAKWCLYFFFLVFFFFLFLCLYFLICCLGLSELSYLSADSNYFSWTGEEDHQSPQLCLSPQNMPFPGAWLRVTPERNAQHTLAAQRWLGPEHEALSLLDPTKRQCSDWELDFWSQAGLT